MNHSKNAGDKTANTLRQSALTATWLSLGSAVLSVLTTLSDKRDPQLMAVPEYGRGPLILDFA